MDAFESFEQSKYSLKGSEKLLLDIPYYIVQLNSQALLNAGKSQQETG